MIKQTVLLYFSGRTSIRTHIFISPLDCGMIFKQNNCR